MTLVNDTTIADATAEAIIDQAIYLLNTYGCTLANLTAGTVTVTSREAGAILSVAVEVYSQYYKSAGSSSSSYGLGGLSVSQSAAIGGGTSGLHAIAKTLADQLLAKTIVRT
jgi:hypothetical protein